ncbi:MAG: hypothetical protein IT269_14015 [Saprospiraceae bacterium]|nr:hypothetical protein [Saprospiraceae bacterium]
MEDLELFKKIKRVEPDPYLFTRVKAKIRFAAEERISWGWSLAGSLAFGALVVFNVLTMQTQRAYPEATLLQQMNLDTSNQLYDE